MLITIVTNELLMQKARTLNNTGIVMQQDAYSYLKIDDGFIHELYNLLDTKLTIAKPDYFSAIKSAGAHITITYNEENIVLDQEDLEKTHTFSLEKLSYVVLENKGYFALLVASPSLEKLRIKYGLYQKPCYRGIPIEFHITIAHI